MRDGEATMLRTRFTELVGCEAPIENAGMGAITGPALAAAVADAGGLGIVGQPMGPLDAFLDALPAGGAIGVNFIKPFVEAEQVAAIAPRVRVCDFFWFDPDPGLVETAHDGGALVSWQVGSGDEARAAEDAGADFVIAQSFESGGHLRGRVALLPLLTEVLDAVDVPVLTAGGVASARGLAAVLAAGADGVRLGTAFIATPESGAHEKFKEALVGASAVDAQPTSAFHVCPLCPSTHRALRQAVEAAEALSEDTVGEISLGGLTMTLPRFAGAPPIASASGHIEAMAMYAGQSVGQIHEVRPAGAVVRELVEGAERLLARWR